MMKQTSKTSVWAVVPAAGIGARMQADKPKQYLSLLGKTVLEHTLHCLSSHPMIKGIVIAIAENDRWWPEINADFSCPVYNVVGGEQRSDSVLSAIQALSKIDNSDPWVLVHDAARPCLRHDDIDQMLTNLQSHPVGGVLGIPITDTIKGTDSENRIKKTLVRTNLWRALTPQMFRLQLLEKALNEAKKKQVPVTDEASAIELAGLEAMMVLGHADNIKITLPHDLELARLFLQQQRRSTECE